MKMFTFSESCSIYLLFRGMCYRRMPKKVWKMQWWEFDIPCSLVENSPLSFSREIISICWESFEFRVEQSDEATAWEFRNFNSSFVSAVKSEREVWEWKKKISQRKISSILGYDDGENFNSWVLCFILSIEKTSLLPTWCEFEPTSRVLSTEGDFQFQIFLRLIFAFGESWQVLKQQLNRKFCNSNCASK